MSFRRARILAFLNPYADSQKTGFHIIQSLIAVGTGGVTGTGLMEGKQKLFYLPEPHTDFIFAVTAEELGLVGALLVVALFAIFLWRGMRVCWRTDDLFGRYLAVGITSMVVLQAFINISVVLGMMPTKGIPLAARLLWGIVALRYSSLRGSIAEHYEANGVNFATDLHGSSRIFQGFFPSARICVWLTSCLVYSHFMRAILAGGGTGGHVIPALAIANQLKKSYSAEVLFIGTARGIENRLVPAAGFPLQLVRVGALKNVSLTTRLKTAFDLPRAVWDAGRMLNQFAPDVVIGVGGYASGPAMLSAVVKHIPTLAFEPNVVPGFANRMVARFVSGAAVHFEETAKYFRHAEVTGVPVRQAFFEIAPKRGGVPTLLVFGGSQGAHAINDAMIRCLPALQREAPGIHIIHQTGERDYNDALTAYSRAE